MIDLYIERVPYLLQQGRLLVVVSSAFVVHTQHVHVYAVL